VQLQFRAEFFNSFNHVSFTGISTSLPATKTNTTYGQVTAVGPVRTTPLTSKLEF
jgi:hypothetical protein